jgi:hypothetical protein
MKRKKNSRFWILDSGFYRVIREIRGLLLIVVLFYAFLRLLNRIQDTEYRTQKLKMVRYNVSYATRCPRDSAVRRPVDLRRTLNDTSGPEDRAHVFQCLLCGGLLMLMLSSEGLDFGRSFVLQGARLAAFVEHFL